MPRPPRGGVPRLIPCRAGTLPRLSFWPLHLVVAAPGNPRPSTPSGSVTPLLLSIARAELWLAGTEPVAQKERWGTHAAAQTKLPQLLAARPPLLSLRHLESR